MTSKRGVAHDVRDETMKLGADLVAIATAESLKGAPKGHGPEDILRGAKSIISIALAVPSAAFDSAPSREYSISYIVANNELNRIAFRVARLLERRGFKALPIPASPPYDLENNMGDMSHRHAAIAAGLGVLGRNSLLLTPQFGGRVRLTTIVTDAELEPDEPIVFDPCAGCDRCIVACPARALKGYGVVDKRKCDQHHLKVGKELQLKDWEQMCGVCIRVCPVGRKRKG
ncbi:MAG TPA: 4Fe-4S double cluster binding domain-containing protein [Thermoplasmata archaeon]